MMPTQTEVELPLLEALIELGGQSRPRALSTCHGEVSAADAGGPGGAIEAWRVRLNNPYPMDSATAYRRWRLGKSLAGHLGNYGAWPKRVQDNGHAHPISVRPVCAVSLVDLYLNTNCSFAELLDKLYELTPTQFVTFRISY